MKTVGLNHCVQIAVIWDLEAMRVVESEDMVVLRRAVTV